MYLIIKISFGLKQSQFKYYSKTVKLEVSYETKDESKAKESKCEN